MITIFRHPLSRFTLFLFGILLGSMETMYAQLTENNYRIYSVEAGREVTLQDIANDMENHDVLFFGEEHNDSVTHYLEMRMLETLAKTYQNEVALSMEMFDRDVQTVMNEYLTGDIREKNFLKDSRAWSNYKD